MDRVESVETSEQEICFTIINIYRSDCPGEIDFSYSVFLKGGLLDPLLKICSFTVPIYIPLAL